MLNDEGIAERLRDTIEHLRNGNLEQAGLGLRALDFERLTKPYQAPFLPSVGNIQFIDPALQFGVERVHETWAHIRGCLGAIDAGDCSAALAEAEQAAARWAMQ